YRVTTTGGTTFTTTVRVINRVHDHTANGGTNTAPAHGTGLADGAQVVLVVRDFAQGGTAICRHLAHFTRTQTQGYVLAFLCNQLHGGTGTARQLGTLARLHLDAMHVAAQRNVA